MLAEENDDAGDYNCISQPWEGPGSRDAGINPLRQRSIAGVWGIGSVRGHWVSALKS
jgi:hypothetical protein